MARHRDKEISMASQSLGRLEKVDLRTAWLSESGDFTPWLAREENLSLLGEAIGIELELEAQEKEVGPFRADILCKDTATDDWVLIENQLERTDHTHLGQLLTYAAGLNAVTIVWISKRFTEEHRATLDWLNERTDDNIKLFGLEIELWRIGDSPIAPKFNIICQPNDWSRTVQQAAAGTLESSPHKQLQSRFWTDFREYMETNSSFVRCQKPRPQHWMNHHMGRSGIHLASIVSLWNSELGNKGPEIRVQVYLDGPSSKREFAVLQNQRENIERALGFPVIWHNPADKASCRIYVRKDADFQNESLWLEQFEWLRKHLEIMHQVFKPIVMSLRLTEEVVEENAE
jgi:hypothetical protein